MTSYAITVCANASKHALLTPFAVALQNTRSFIGVMQMGPIYIESLEIVAKPVWNEERKEVVLA